MNTLSAILLILGFATTVDATPQDSTNWRPTTLSASLSFLAYVSGDTVYCGYTKLYRTFDGGITWDTLPLPGVVTYCAFRDARTGIFPGDKYVFKTTDAGQTWTPHAAGINRLHRIRWNGHDTAFVSTDGAVCRSTDAGETWRAIPGVGGGWDVAFRDSKVGAVCGDRDYFPGHSQDEPYSGQLAISANGGETWTPVFSGIRRGLKCEAYVHPDLLFIGAEGGMICRTTDRGLTWDSVLVPIGLPQTISFLDARHGAMCGGGSVALTSNAGQTWVTEFIPGSSILYDVRMLNDTVAYAAGSGLYVRRAGSMRVTPTPRVNRPIRALLMSNGNGIELSGNVDQTSTAFIRIFNIDGVEVASIERHVAEGHWTIPVPLTDKPAGTYVYEVTVAGQRSTGKFSLIH